MTAVWLIMIALLAILESVYDRMIADGVNRPDKILAEKYRMNIRTVYRIIKKLRKSKT